MDNSSIPELAPPVIDRPARSRSPARLVLLGLGLALLAVLLFLFGRDKFGEPAVLAVLGGLAGLGVFFLFAQVLGFIRLTAQQHSDTFATQLVDGMDAGLVVTDAEGRIVYANRAYAELLGAQNENEVASVETVFSRRMEASEIVYRMTNAARGGNSAIEEFRLSSGLKSGDEGARWFRLRVRSMRHGDYPKPLNVWQISDITADRKRQELAFQELQNAIHYLDHAPAGFLASEKDGSIVYMNATLADWLGIDLATFEPGKVELSDLVLGDGMALLAAVRPDNRGARTSVIDLDLAKSNGKPLPVRLYHRVPVTPDGAPGVSRTIVVNRMLGEEAGDPLRAAEVRFTRFFNNTPVAIASLSADGSVRRVNAPFQRMFAGVISRKGGVEALKIGDLASGEARVPLDAAWAEAIAGQAQIKPVDVPLEGEDGRHVRFFVSPVTGEEESDGEDDRVIIYVLDMSEQRALQEQFAQGQKMQAVGQLAGGVAHDFNNVLTAIIGFSDLLLASHRPSDRSFQDIMNIKQNANRAASLVRQLLAFSRRQTLRPQVIQLGDVLSDLRMLLARLLGEKVDLQVVHGRDLWPVKADLSQFEQVVVNLAVNARDAMPEGGKLTIRTANIAAADVRACYPYKEMPAADYVLLEVEDEGTGMSAGSHGKDLRAVLLYQGSGQGHRARPFDRLRHRQADRRLHLSRERSGQGHRVPRLPAATYSNSSGNCRGIDVVEDIRKEKPRDLTGSAVILLVEDEDAVRAFASRALTSRGYEVHEASSGAEALEIYTERGSGFDLVISDVVMPEMDGPTLVPRIAQERAGPKVHLHVRLCRGSLRQEPAGGRPGGFRVPAQAVQPQAVGDRREGRA